MNGSAKCQDCRECDFQAALNLVQNGITNLVVTGDVSLTVSNLFRQDWESLLDDLVYQGKMTAKKKQQCSSLNKIGMVSGMVDNDFCGNDMTMCTDSALDRIIEAIDAIVTTASRYPTHVGLKSEADFVFIPEWPTTLCEKLKMIIVDNLQQDTRVTVLGHVQRGGSPSDFDRILSSRMGAEAVLALLEAKSGAPAVVVSLDGNQSVRVHLMECVMKIQERHWSEVADWVGQGGAFLGTKRTWPNEIMEKVVEQCRKEPFQGLLVAGGFEAYHSVLQMADQRDKNLCIRVSVTAASVCNNVPGTDFSLGSDSALNEITELKNEMSSSHLADAEMFVRSMNPSLKIIRNATQECNFSVTKNDFIVKGDVKDCSYEFYVKTVFGKTITIHSSFDVTVEVLKGLIEDKEGIPPQHQLLFVAGKNIDNTFDMKCLNGRTIMLGLRLRGGMLINVEFPSGKIVDLNVKETDTVELLKNSILDIEYVGAPNTWFLSYLGHRLHEQNTIDSYNIHSGHTLQMFYKDVFQQTIQYKKMQSSETPDKQTAQFDTPKETLVKTFHNTKSASTSKETRTLKNTRKITADDNELCSFCGLPLTGQHDYKCKCKHSIHLNCAPKYLFREIPCCNCRDSSNDLSDEEVSSDETFQARNGCIRAVLKYCLCCCFDNE
ncbi:ATP-dependent 6-phosphofructokinase [Araneus ventricosus]|uniref:6-phosphofructokinase n=1 Tax=Araneus ventricosus TaxID=182803 RepID=A0A4Y2JV41_ARAVE|nr:ATP-dependent 6-phosphofructokinase [Araneus ventricosus]